MKFKSALMQVQEPTSAWAQKVSLLVFLISDIALVFWYTEPYMKEKIHDYVNILHDKKKKYSEIQLPELFVS